MKISAIVAARNEGGHIGRCLMDLLEQGGIADDDLEIVVVDERSTDRTVNVVRSFPEFGTRIRLIDGGRKLRAHAWNVGWRAARGEYIAFIGAHSSYGPEYLRGCLLAIERTGAGGVGPVQVPAGTSTIGKAVAWSMSSRFGVGNARFRFARCEQEVDSVYSMFLRRETLEQLGGYDERVAFDADSEFNYRLRAAGGRIVVSPDLHAVYFVCNSLRALGRQMFCYGYWRRFTRVLHPKQIPPRVYAPPAFVAGLGLSILLWLSSLWQLALIVPLAYAAFVTIATLSAIKRIGLPSAFCVALALPSMHLSYGAGFWCALLTRRGDALLRTARNSVAR